MANEYNIQAKDRLIQDIINADIQASLVNAAFVLSVPKPTTANDMNTELTINAYVNGNKVNCMVSHYNREFLDDVLGLTTATNMSLTGFITTHDLLPSIFTNYGIKLDETDIVLENLADTNNVIRAASGSYGWLGSFEFTSNILEFPPLIRTTTNRLLSTHSGKYLIRVYPTFPIALEK